LDLTKDDLYAKFFAGVRKIAALSLAIGYPTVASVPHVLGGAFRKLLYVGAGAGYEFKEAKAFMEAGASAAAAPVAAAAAGGKAAAAAPAPAKGGKKKEEPKEEAPVEEEEAGFGGMFD